MTGAAYRYVLFVWLSAFTLPPIDCHGQHPSHLPHRRRACRSCCAAQPEKVYRLAARGELPSYKVEGRRLFDQGEVLRWLESRRASAVTRPAERLGWPRSAHTRPPRVSAATRCAFATAAIASDRGSSRSTRTRGPSSSTSSGGRQAGILYQAAPERVRRGRSRRGSSGTSSAPPDGCGRARSRSAWPRTASAYLTPLNRSARSSGCAGRVVEDLIATIAERAPRRAEMALSLLKRILRDAEERGQLVDPAVYRIRIAKAEEREPRFLTWAEADELRSWMPEYVAPDRADRDPDHAPPRRGARAARRRHRPGGRLDRRLRPAPGRRARRDQDARRRDARSTSARAAVRLLREQQLARAPNADGYLFATRVGAPFDADNFMHRVFKPAAKAAGIPELTFHDLRHTGASLMIAAGCHVKVIAEQMGHSDGGGARPEALRTPLQGRSPAGRDGPRGPRLRLRRRTLCGMDVG